MDADSGMPSWPETWMAEPSIPVIYLEVGCMLRLRMVGVGMVEKDA